MTPIQATNLAEQIARMYPYLENDETYMAIWVHVSKDADYEKTLQRYYAYLADPIHARKPPMPADLLVRESSEDGFEQERENMNRWEAEARRNPPDWKKLKNVIEKIESGGLEHVPDAK